MANPKLVWPAFALSVALGFTAMSLLHRAFRQARPDTAEGRASAPTSAVGLPAEVTYDLATAARLVEKRPSSARGHFQLGMAWIGHGDDGRAVGELERSRQSQEPHVTGPTWWYLADCRQVLGEPDRALTVLA